MEPRIDNMNKAQAAVLPKVALVGRPNVGKSTLFNRVSGRRKAITDSRPGSTRDRNYARAEWRGVPFELVDTGGLIDDLDDPLLGPAQEQAGKAIREADLVLLLVDARGGFLPDDAAIAARLRRQARRILLVANKIDQEIDPGTLADFARLGFEEPIPISAEHGRGVGDLLDRVLDEIGTTPVVTEETPAPLRIALLGRPNVGKSSLLNRLLGNERAVVSPIPGTTRDAVDGELVRGGRRYVIVDTAGIRRQRHLKENVDHVSVVQAEHAAASADIGVVVLDGEHGLHEMDAVIAGKLDERGRGLVLAVNKWDGPRLKPGLRSEWQERVHEDLKFAPYAPIVFVSAFEGKGIDKLFGAIEHARESSQRRVATGPLNRVLQAATDALPPKSTAGGRPPRLLYAAQIGITPPRFVLTLNRKVKLHFSYLRYIENQLRKEFDFLGTPIQIKVRERRH
jgi:GTPase